MYKPSSKKRYRKIREDVKKSTKKIREAFKGAIIKIINSFYPLKSKIFRSSIMDKDDVCKAWIWSGLEDLFFGFIVQTEQHRPYKIFNEILGLEKILKAYLLFHNSDRYENLSEEQTKEAIENLVRKEYRHSIKKMLKMASKYLPSKTVDNLKAKDFDGFTGQEMIRAIEAGYMESRYPTLKPIYEQFKIKDLDIYRDPLGSSDVTRFIYEVDRTILNDLRNKVDLSSVKERFTNTYQIIYEEFMQRFINLAFNGSIDDFL